MKKGSILKTIRPSTQSTNAFSDTSKGNHANRNWREKNLTRAENQGGESYQQPGNDVREK